MENVKLGLLNSPARQKILLLAFTLAIIGQCKAYSRLLQVIGSYVHNHLLTEASDMHDLSLEEIVSNQVLLAVFSNSIYSKRGQNNGKLKPKNFS